MKRKGYPFQGFIFYPLPSTGNITAKLLRLKSTSIRPTGCKCDACWVRKTHNDALLPFAVDGLIENSRKGATVSLLL